MIFFQTLLGPCAQSCIPRLRAIGPLVPEKKIFKGFLPYMGPVVSEKTVEEFSLYESM